MKITSLFRWCASAVAQRAKDAPSKYVDLAPTDEADEHGIYADALMVATNNPNVSNIALTGPYGSGKSSIIKTFRRRYRRPVLQISLAAFLPEADGSVTTNETQAASPKKGNVSKQEIERSILQQMLYGADSNSLPLSRFKRIQTPRWWSKFTSLFIMAGLFSCWHLFSNRDAVLSGEFFKPVAFANWLNFVTTSVGFLFIWLAFHQIYIKSLGLSLKSISLKDIEITPETAKEESILNRHLDEIIYFFQATKYDLVIIEDLDRFNSPEIFVTLREINSLVNANAGVKRPIRFLYALRDNMFVNTDRTKFFEFIVPVIPIINSSNSIDKVIEQGQRLSLDERLDRQFLREVSRYLSDLRLIHNIFNEYTVYVANLETDGENILDANKLLAILIYKNVLPSDFEDLHREKGKLAEILRRHDAYVTKAEALYKARISQLEYEISDAEKLIPGDLEELRKIYAMALIAKLPQGFTSIVTPNGEIVPFSGLTMHPDFEEIIEQDHITALQAYYNNRQSVNIKGFQKTVSEVLTYKDRKAIIERKSAEFRAAAAKDIQALRLKIAALRTAKFNEVVRTNSEDIEELFDAFGDNTDLVRFLVLEGFLDDTYYQYTSLFHRGRLSPSDNKFLIQIRSFKTPDPEFQIDNPTEVIAAMRDDDFRQKFVLNVTLVDCLLGNFGQYRSQIVKLIDYVSSNFDECATFFSAYYQTGQRNSELLTTLVDRWPGLVGAAIAAPQNAVHVARMIAHLPARVLETLARKSTEISEYLASNLASVLALQVDFEPSRLALFQFETEDLDSVGPYPAAVRVLSDHGLYTITAENVGFIFRNVLGSGGAADLETKHYSTVLRAQYAPLIDKVHSDFDRYLKGLLLRPSNSEEDVSVILDVLNHEEIDPEFLEQFLEQQGAKLPTLERVPARLRSAVFRLSRIEPSWENCLTYLSSEEFDAKTLTAYLERTEVRSILSQLPVGGQNEARPLRLFLFNNDDFDIDSYRAYIRRLPRKFDQFSETVREEKLRVLVEEEAVTFSEKAFSFLAGKEALQVLFVAKNIDSFLANEDKYSVNDDFREKLLDSAIGDERKLKVIDKMDLTALGVSAHRASLVGRIIHRTDANVSNLPAEAACAMVVNLEPVEIQVALFNRCQKLMSDEQVRAVIQQLPKPYSEIEPGWRQPTIPNTLENQELVRWLQSRSIISSSKVTVSFFSDAEIRIFNFRK
ncbi:ATP-binding protein [Sinorhizobium medicae]|uniref:YobI family P-loop NTPase n=1 Tax=Sinorhizobium medicae TaxID=110321 RepID=UPI001F4700EC|nr:ATP-binding protein [Sinorhizobium medicae]UWU12037.1 ATP-binding protein [Sinorhizobium medicae]